MENTMQFICCGLVILFMAMSWAGSRPIADVPKRGELTNKSEANIDTNEKSKTYCSKGEKYDKELDGCKACDKNTYMSELRHRNTRCNPCPQIDYEAGEIFLNNKTECTKESPPEIGCLLPSHYYKYPEPGFFATGDCELCSSCRDSRQYEGRKCANHSNTVCCSLPDMDVVDTYNGPQCVNRTMSTTSVTNASVITETVVYSTTTPPQKTTKSSNTTAGQIVCGKDEVYVPGNSSCQQCHNETECLRKHEESPNKFREKIFVIVIIVSIAFIIIIITVIVCFMYKQRRTVTPTDSAEKIAMLNLSDNNTNPMNTNNERFIADGGHEDRNTRGGDINNGGQNTGDDDINSGGQNTGDDDINSGGQNTGDDDINSGGQNTGDDDINSGGQNTVLGGGHGAMKAPLASLKDL